MWKLSGLQCSIIEKYMQSVIFGEVLWDNNWISRRCHQSQPLAYLRWRFQGHCLLEWLYHQLPDYHGKSAAFEDIMKPMLDQHPNLRSLSKVLLKRGKDRRSISMGDTTTWEVIMEIYNGCWMADQHCTVCDTDGNIARDTIEVLNSNFQKP